MIKQLSLININISLLFFGGLILTRLSFTTDELQKVLTAYYKTRK